MTTPLTPKQPTYSNQIILRTPPTNSRSKSAPPSSIKTPRRRVSGEIQTHPEPPPTTIKKIIAFVGALFVGIVTGLLVVAAGMLLTGIVLLPLTSQSNAGIKKITQQATQYLVSAIGSITTVLFSLKYGIAAGDDAYRLIIEQIK